MKREERFIKCMAPVDVISSEARDPGMMETSGFFRASPVEMTARRLEQYVSSFALHSSRFTSSASKGFTLVEVLIAIAILASGLILVVQGMVRTQQAIRISENLAQASLIAQEEMAKPELIIKQGGKLDYGEESGRAVISGNGFSWVRRAEAYREDSLDDETKMNRAQLTLNWNDGPARMNQEKIETLFLNREKKIQE